MKIKERNSPREGFEFSIPYGKNKSLEINCSKITVTTDVFFKIAFIPFIKYTDGVDFFKVYDYKKSKVFPLFTYKTKFGRQMDKRADDADKLEDWLKSQYIDIQ